MNKITSDKLINLNRIFYSQNADEFDISRNKHYWQLFEYILKENNKNFFKLDDNYIFILGNLTNSFLNKKNIKILDLGCGNGRIIEFLCNHELLKDKYIEYVGIDFSKRFLEITKDKVEKIKTINSNFKYSLLEIDLTNIEELKRLEEYKDFDLIIGMAVIHHIPGKDLRREIVKYLETLLSTEGKMFLTAWDFLKSNSNLVANPNIVGIEKINLEPNDYILSWKKSSYRYLCLLDSASDFS